MDLNRILYDEDMILSLCLISSAVFILVKCQPPLSINFIFIYFVFEKKVSSL